MNPVIPRRHDPVSADLFAAANASTACRGMPGN